MLIGIPKEILAHERRVAAVPETVEKLVDIGFQVVVEAGAGEGVFIEDARYQQAGATISTDVARLCSSADIILKVKQPCFNEQLQRHEVKMFKRGCILITFLHPAAPSSHAMVKGLRDRDITSFTMDGIPRTSRAQRMDALTSMSTVSGYKSVLMAANCLPTFVPLMGTAIGMLKPARFLVVGAGVVGLQAIATAKRLGGQVTCVDIRPEAREECKSLGVKVEGFEVPPDLARGEGGYARALPEEWLDREREVLAPLVEQSDVVILSALVPGEIAPVLVTKEMITRMKPGSMIVDVSIDQGGNCAVTRAGEDIVAHGVPICGAQNLPGRVPVHATYLYARNMLHYVQNLFKEGPGMIDWDDEIVTASLVTHDGKILHAGLLKELERE